MAGGFGSGSGDGHGLALDEERGETDLGGFGIVEADEALLQARDGGAFEAQGVESELMGGVVGEAGVAAFALDAGTVQEFEASVASRSGAGHEFQGQPAHGEARVDFDHGLEPAPLVGIAIDEGVDPEGTEVAGGGEMAFQVSDKTFDRLLEEVRECRSGGLRGSGGPECGEHGGRWAVPKIGRGSVGHELAAGVGDETGVTEEFQPGGGSFELDGELADPIEPRFDHDLASVLRGAFEPASLGFEQVRFPETEGVGSGESERLFDDDPVVSGGADGLDQVEGFVEGTGGVPDGRARGEPVGSGCFGAEEVEQERGAPGFGKEPGARGRGG